MDTNVWSADMLDPERDYPDFPEFERFGIDLSLVSGELMEVLQQLRTDSGIPIIPSPADGGWGRVNGSIYSRHYAVGRLCDAGDIFPARGRALELWTHVFAIPEVQGVGLYLDTSGPDGNLWPMMHIDLRQARTLWMRANREYFYLHRSPVEFWRAVGQLIQMEAPVDPPG